MRQSISYILSLSIFLLIMESCAPAYVPNVLNVPMLEKGGEFQIAGYGGTSGYDLQTAYAYNDHVGFMANISYQDTKSDSVINEHNHLFLEFASGYYTNIGEEGRFDIYAGWGFGSLEARFDNNIFISSANVHSERFFVQPSIGIDYEHIELSLASRLVYLTLTQEQVSEEALFIEPVGTLKVGSKMIKGVSQIGLSLPLDEENVDFYYQPFIMSIGLQLALNPKKRKSNNP